jgi:hypothetical protein
VLDATGSGSGWNVTVQGDSGSGKSAVFKEYCTDGTASNGCNTAVGGGPGPGYVTDGFTLPAGSLTLNSTGADFTGLPGTVGTAPSHLCSAGCALDSATAVSVASIATGLGLGTWLAQGYSSASVSLATPSTLRYIGAGNKVYRVNLLWTLASGP